VKKLIFLLCAAVPAILAQDPATAPSVPAFAADWRVTGVIRQGGRAEASMERAGVRARFVREGDRLPGDIMVVQVDYANRSVTLSKGNETAVLQPENMMAPPPPPPKPVGMPQSMNRGSKPGPWPNPPSKPTAMRDGNGRWHIVFPNGHSMDMHAFAERHGGVKGAMDYVKNHLQQSSHTSEREEYHKQELEALKQMQAAGLK